MDGRTSTSSVMEDRIQWDCVAFWVAAIVFVVAFWGVVFYILGIDPAAIFGSVIRALFSRGAK